MSAISQQITARPRRAWRWPWGSLAMLLPATALMIIFFLAPLVVALYLAFTNMELEGAHAVNYQFTGLANFTRMASDSFFLNSIWLTIIFVGGSAIIGQSAMGMIMALLAERAVPWLRVSIGAVVITAWVIPEITTAVIWYAFAQNGGTLDLLLGPGQAQTNWLLSAPMLIVCLANVWRGTAFCMLIFGAGLRNVPEEVTESAILDGASTWQRLLLVTLPLMKPTIVTNFILVTIGNLSDFTLIYAMTQGGPSGATQTLPLYMYLQSFTFYQLGYGTAIAVVLILVGAVASLVYVRLLRTEI